MPINLQDIISRVTSQVNESEKTAEEVAAVAAVAAAPAVVPAVAPVVTAAPVENLEEQQKVAAEMDEAGRVMARAFYDELNKLAVSAHGYVDTAAENPENPAVQVSTKPERLDNAMKAVSIIQQLTAGERVKGPEGYVQVNGQPVAATAPEIPVEEHPVAYDATKRASAKIIEAVYSKYFGGK
jgi:hypothetical protein